MNKAFQDTQQTLQNFPIGNVSHPKNIFRVARTFQLHSWAMKQKSLYQDLGKTLSQKYQCNEE